MPAASEDDAIRSQVGNQLTGQCLESRRPSLVDYLKTFPADVDLDDEVFARNRTPNSALDLDDLTRDA
jgi:hypothetical protein